jgi:hypothetical protein
MVDPDEGNVPCENRIGIARPRNETRSLSLIPDLWVKSGTGSSACESTSTKALRSVGYLAEGMSGSNRVLDAEARILELSTRRAC